MVVNAGKVVGGRFEILAEIGQGGGGTIYKARDLRAETFVAVKVMRGLGKREEARFQREARVLAQIDNPGLVAHIAHGLDGEVPYLAMQWLDGEDLRVRLRREELTLSATLVLARRVAGVLASLHDSGLVHRDIKPSNLFLPGGRPEDTKVLDLGLVRTEDDEPLSLTRTGLAVGTPGFMAPEQARADKDVDARADVFSLGCVLYRCLSGKAPFHGAHLIEVMTKVLLQEPAPLAEICPDVPAELSALVHRMLEKDPALRPRSGAEVARALAGVTLSGDPSAGGRTPANLRVPALTGDERRLASVILVGREVGRRHRPEDAAGKDAAGKEARSPEGQAALETVLRTYGASLDRLAGDVLVVHVSGKEGAGDPVARAARCALAIRATMPRAPIAFSTGLSEVTGMAPVGDAIERATALLAYEHATLVEALAGGHPCPAWIAADAVTASLLREGFDLRESEGRWRLHGTAGSSTGARPLLGKTIPTVGREWETSTLLAAFRASADEGSTRALLVTGPGGAGKSRLARELTRAVRADAESVEIWSAACVSSAAGSPFAVLAGLLRSALDLDGRVGAEDAEMLLFEAVAQRLPADRAARAAEVFADVMGVPIAPPSAALRAARSDPRIFAERLRTAWQDLVTAACAKAPVVTILEDLHWGDASTIRLLGDMLAALPDRPWMVVAFARPEIDDTFPRLWQEHDCQHIRLRPLTRRAAEQIVRHVLGAEAPSSAVSRIVAQADGNAFFLEELIRAFAAGGGDDMPMTLPETVLAVVQARIAQLDAQARRVLRAASVLGEVFWPSAVEALLGEEAASSSATLWVDALVTQEIFVRRPHSRFVGEVELAFRHTLLREGAYAMLTEPDRVLGHRLAGEWLQKRGETDALVLAKHFDEGQAPEAAALHYAQAARRAVGGMDLDAAIDLAGRARSLSVNADVGNACDLALAEAHIWRSEWAQAQHHAAEILKTARPGSNLWVRAKSLKQAAAFGLGNVPALMGSIMALASAEPEKEAYAAAIQAFGVALFVLCLGAQAGAVRALLPRLDGLVAGVTERHLVPLGWASAARGVAAAWLDGDPWTGTRHLEAACALFDEAADRPNGGFFRGVLGLTYLELGAYGAAEKDLHGMGTDGDPTSLIGATRRDLTILLALARGRHENVRAAVAEMLAMKDTGGMIGNMRAGRARGWLGDLAERAGDLETAEREHTGALAMLRTSPTLWPAAATSLARVQLRRGHAREALATVREVTDALGAQGIAGLGAASAGLAQAEAHLACGERDEARRALSRLKTHLLDVAIRIPDEATRAGYLGLTDHARILALASAGVG